MELLVLLLVAAGVALAMRHGARTAQTKRLTVGEGQLRHLRSGEYPSACSWCKSTTLAKKLLVYARTAEGWESSDVMMQLARCTESEVSTLSSALRSDHPNWRRFCGEACVSQFFTQERAPLRERFVACAYCSTRAPETLLTCPTCGARR